MNATGIPAKATPLTLRANTAQDLMAPNPISIRAKADLSEVTQLFTSKGIDATPVTDESGRPIGVISRSDLLVHHHEKDQAEGTTKDATSNPSKVRQGSDCSQCTVADLMTPAIFAVALDTPAHRVVSDMVGLHVHQLFVVGEDGSLVGVISTMDVLKKLSADQANA